MNGDAVSDLVLALVCGVLFTRERARRPGFAVAALLIGVAASLGVLRFSGLTIALGPHRFASLVAACAAFPLLACVRSAPADPLSVRLSAAARFAALAGALGVAATVIGVPAWGQVVPGASALWILWTAIRRFDAVALLGALLLLASFAAAGLGSDEATYLGVASRVQLLHYLMAAALVAFALSPRRLPIELSESPPSRG